jgi:membrane protein implicated in regulation of membrane protease activity
MMPWIWVGLLILFLIVEACTVGLVTIWFALGSLAAFISTFFTENLEIQMLVFIISTIITLLMFRPFFKKYINKKRQPTNVDMNIGAEGIVVKKISNINSIGSVKVKGIVWSALSSNTEVEIPEGTTVIVEKIEGVKLIVSPKVKNNEDIS